MTRDAANARYIADAVRMPVIADADNGYGNAINVIRTVREYIGAGVAGIHLEDQVSPKRCGHVAGRLVIPLDEAVGKIRAAADTRDGARPGLRAHRPDRRARRRTAAALDEAIRRANALPRGGRGPGLRRGPDRSVDEVQRICAR